MVGMTVLRDILELVMRRLQELQFTLQTLSSAILFTAQPQMVLFLMVGL